MHNNNIQSPKIKDDIAKRLEKLNKWQEEQKKLLQERQNMQRQMLGMEQRKMYEMLGIHAGEGDSNISLQCVRDRIGVQSYNDNSVIKNCEEMQKDGTKEDLQQVVLTPSKPKKSFLRRGEGLKQRFKIDPDALRLNNLPRYKYANFHSRFSKGNQSRPVPKTLKPMEQPDSNCEELVDVHERRFQQLLISANNFCNSTPDTKLTISASTTSVELNKQRFLELAENAEEAKHVQYDTDSALNSKPCSRTSVSWAKVLDAQQIKPISMRQLRPAVNPFSGLTDHDENLSIFELLEQKANEGSIDMNSSCIRQFFRRKSCSDDDEQDRIPVQSCIKSSGLLPNVAEINSLSQSDSEDVEDLTGTEHKSELSDTLTTEKQSESCRPCVQVRFSDTNDTHEYTEESETSTVLADESSSAEVFQQFKDALFTVLQLKGYRSQNDTSVSINSKCSNQYTPLQAATPEDLHDIINLIKSRLAELEKEIAQFKDNNIKLIKAKQEHELERAHFEQEREERFEKLNDEKIQMEIYLHDERMKLEEEKRKFERQMQMQKSSATSQSRKEKAKLKQELEDLQMQLKQKEQAHVAAQARLRAQIRNLEKDQKQLYEDNERLMKENKRLQNENLQIGRENNNKMLQEINRNIAKLAPKLTHVTYLDEDASRRTKVPNTSTSSACKSSEMKDQRRSQKKSKRFEAKSNCCKPNKKQVSRTYNDSKSSSECEGFVSDQPEHDMEDLENIVVSKNNKQTQSQSLATPLTANTKDGSNELKREIINSDGSKDVLYCNGNLKKISADGMSIRMLYFNKDIKETNINEGTVKYYYSETNTWHTTYLDGLEILEFPNGQTEHRYQNGVVEVHFPNNSIKVTDPADEHKLEEWRFEDGTHLVELRNGDKILTLPNGQKEIHTKLNKRREYPDGTVKFVYPDGSQETRYSNGRVRLKDKEGNLVMDTENVT